MQCPVCDHQNPDGARFCSNCGTALTAPAPASEERRIVTVLFADIAGFTGLAEALDPEDLQAVVARFYAAMAQEVRRFGGTVEKYVGDAALAIFGLPDVHEDDAERAVRAALAMQQALVRLNEHLMREGGPPLGMRVGINTGEVVADPKGGALGEFHLAADALNVAARLQTHGEAGQILLGPRTERLVRGVVELTPMGEITLKGKGQPVAAWQVVGLRAERAQRGLPGRQAPLIGRSDEMDLLLRVYDRLVRERQPHLVTVLGVPGVGKSRLQIELLALVRALPASPLVRKGRCLPYGERAFSAVAEILTSDAGILDGDPPETARGKLTEAVRRVAPDDPDRLAAALGFLIGLAFPASAIAAYDPRAAREEAFRSWRHYLKLRAAAQPLVLVIEDVHWADDGLLDLLDHTATRLADVPVMLLCMARPELLERWPQWGGAAQNATRINLTPLDEGGTRALLSALAGDALPEDVRGRILAVSEGNPFFVEEIVRLLVEQGAVVEVAGRWQSAAHVDAVPIPDTVQGVLAARLDRLPEGEKRLLQYAAVIGRFFWIGPLHTLVPTADLASLLDRLESRDLVRERDASTLAGDREFMFKHILTREVAYASLPKAVRSPAHASVARWIEQTAGERVGEAVDLLAYHWSSAGDVPRAVEYLIRAGDRAREVFANRRAVEAYTAALELGSLTPAQREHLHRGRGDARQRLGEYQGARGDFEAALRALEESGDRRHEGLLRFEITRVEHRQRSRPIPELVAGYAEARRIAAAVGDRRTEGLALLEMANAHWDESRPEAAEQAALEALRILQETGDHGAIAGAMTFMGRTRWTLLDLDGYREWELRGLAEARLSGDRAREGTALSFLGLLNGYAGKVDEALRVLDQSERISEEIGDRRRIMWIDYFRGYPQLCAARYDRAIAALETAQDLARAIGYPNPLSTATLAHAYQAAGDVERACEVLAGFAAQMPADDIHRPFVLLCYAAALAERGLLDQHAAEVETAEHALAGRPLGPDVLRGGAWLAHAMLHAGRVSRAADLAERVLSLAPRGWLPETVANAHAVVALAALDDARLDDAEGHLGSADAALEGFEFPACRAEVHLVWSRLRLGQGRAEEAEAHRLEAAALVDQIVAALDDARVRASFQRGSLAQRARAEQPVRSHG